MAVICPTVTAYDAHQYREQMERLQPFAERVHIDLMDGDFAPTKSPGPDQIWWPEGVVADIHLMYRQPAEQLSQLIALKPNLVIIHTEADVDHAWFAMQLQAAGIKAGLAILQSTNVETISEIIKKFDHALVFSGDLGRHGGQADLTLLEKVSQLRQLKPGLEISWDGGISNQNARQLIEGGVDVLNAGGFIQNATEPAQAYKKLVNLIDL